MSSIPVYLTYSEEIMDREEVTETPTVHVIDYSLDVKYIYEGLEGIYHLLEAMGLRTPFEEGDIMNVHSQYTIR